MGNIVNLDIPFRKELSEVEGNEVYYSPFDVIMSGSSTEKNYQKNFLSIERPLKATEVFSKLRKKGWGKFDGRFLTECDLIRSQPRLMYRVYIPFKYGRQETEVDYPEDPIDVIDTGYRNITETVEGENGEEIVRGEIKISPFFQMWPEKFSSNWNHNESERRAIKSEVDELYKSIFGESPNGINVISFRKATRDILDVHNRSVSFDIISSDSDLYTNCLDLSELRGYAVISGVSARIDVTVQYSTYEPEARVPVKIFNRDVTFCAFKYEYNKETNIVECTSDSFQETMNNDVLISYASNTETGTALLELIPVSQRVSECIISRCAVTYGKF